MKIVSYIACCFLLICNLAALAASHNIIIVGSAYSPATLNAAVGDTVTISASTTHPLIQVDEATWNASGTSPLAGGWGTKTSDYTFVITSIADIYYICGNHGSFGMKGQISVSTGPTGLDPETKNLSCSIYPNPAIENMYIQGTKAEWINIYNVIGKLVLSKQLISPRINISGLKNGVYFAIIGDESGEIFSEKLVVKQ